METRDKSKNKKNTADPNEMDDYHEVQRLRLTEKTVNS